MVVLTTTFLNKFTIPAACMTSSQKRRLGEAVCSFNVVRDSALFRPDLDSVQSLLADHTPDAGRTPRFHESLRVPRSAPMGRQVSRDGTAREGVRCAGVHNREPTRSRQMVEAASANRCTSSATIELENVVCVVCGVGCVRSPRSINTVGFLARSKAPRHSISVVLWIPFANTHSSHWLYLHTINGNAAGLAFVPVRAVSHCLT